MNTRDTISDESAMNQIAELVREREWNADLYERVVAVIQASGRSVDANQEAITTLLTEVGGGYDADCTCDACTDRTLAADLLQMHVETAISLDEWPAATRFVQQQVDRAAHANDTGDNKHPRTTWLRSDRRFTVVPNKA